MTTDSVKKRILGLMAKTTDNGCTEEEAMSAAAKVQEMLHAYELDLSDLEIAESECIEGDYDTQVKSDPAVKNVITAVAFFTDTKCWRTNQDDQWGNVHYKFFGLEHDVLIAEYVTKICDWACIWGGEDFKETDTWRFSDKNKRGRLKRDYQDGMASRLAHRLRRMKLDQNKNDIATTGRDLVVVKSSIVESEWEKHGISLGKARKGRGRRVNPEAYSAGQAAGDKVALNPGVEAEERGVLR